MLDVTLTTYEVFYVCSEWFPSTFLILNGWRLFVCLWETFFRPQTVGGAKFLRGIFQTMKTESWGSSNFPVPQRGQSWSLSKQALRVSVMRWNSSLPQQTPLTSPPSLSTLSLGLPGITSCISCFQTKSWISFQGSWDLDGRLQSSSPDSGLRHWLLLSFQFSAPGSHSQVTSIRKSMNSTDCGALATTELQTVDTWTCDSLTVSWVPWAVTEERGQSSPVWYLWGMSEK